ncbi:hypothetical protein, conserved [Babesia bigemina]|uniref:Uncharacterized protein n=1 Tax=Babesia bigemina TaxID=5866 RepID=A0A061BTE8_BABBI|nr:hypothetical protein, conserved [Babesia bigemina]CDR71784.1 hypothetical protein, conserved [Babesia bigemina]|eukprot:XP_012770728.1 hypothetical protein, conserved [Babesia bigemina]
MALVNCLVTSLLMRLFINAITTLSTTLDVIGGIWINDLCTYKLRSSAVESDAEGYLSYEEIADVAAHREAEDAQVEQDDGDDKGNDDGGDGLGVRAERCRSGRQIFTVGIETTSPSGNTGGSRRLCTGGRMGGSKLFRWTFLQATFTSTFFKPANISITQATHSPTATRTTAAPSPLNLQPYQSPSNALTNCNHEPRTSAKDTAVFHKFHSHPANRHKTYIQLHHNYAAAKAEVLPR